MQQRPGKRHDVIHKAPLCTEMYRIKKPFRKRYKPDRKSFSRDNAFLLRNKDGEEEYRGARLPLPV
nr:hypothetical protein FQY85_10430 [Cronobacter turicensis]